MFGKKYRILDDLTSDVLFEAYGKNKKELFENAALALFSVICQVEKVKPTVSKDVEVEGKDLKDLMFNWLQGLIGLYETENMFFSRFKVLEISDNKLRVKCYGEGSKPEKGGTLVKGVTYYKFDLKKTKSGYKVRVSVDI